MQIDRQPLARPLHSNIRWLVCGLLFFATTIAYIDRSVISFIKDDLQRDLGWNEIDYGDVVAWFSLAYAGGYLFAGRLIDRIGVRVGYPLSIGLWSLAVAAHAIPSSLGGFKLARFGLGVSEGGNFPAAIKTISEWFPRKERALATGIFNSGSNVGAILTPLIVTFVSIHYGWRACFVVTGSLGVLWLIAWCAIYRSPAQHPGVSDNELTHITADAPDPAVKVSWLQLLTYRQTWAYVTAVGVTSPVWWFYLYWLPDFLGKTFHLTKQQQRWPVIVVYLIADAGSIAGGWLSSQLIRRGFTLDTARKIAFLVCALCVVPVFFAPRMPTMWGATLLIALAAAAHQGFSANLYTLASDTMPRFAVSSVVGLGGFTGGIMGMFFQKFAGRVLNWKTPSSYLLLFGICSGAYLVAIGAMQLLIPNIGRVRRPVARWG